jgi:hypothetical protein
LERINYKYFKNLLFNILSQICPEVDLEEVALVVEVAAEVALVAEAALVAEEEAVEVALAAVEEVSLT